jgi:hypothetical protein
MNAGGSGELCTTQVRFIVDPLSMYKSGAPIISVDGSAKSIYVDKKLRYESVVNHHHEALSSNKHTHTHILTIKLLLQSLRFTSQGNSQPNI